MIDLSVVFLKYPEHLENQQQLNSLLSDLYPTEKRDRHIIMEIYKSEYWEKIKGGISIDERTIYYWSQMISQDTGISDTLIIEGINAWVGGRDSIAAVAGLNVDEKDSPLYSTKLNTTEAKKATEELIEGILGKISKGRTEKTQRQGMQGALAERYSKDCEESVIEDDTDCLSLDDVDIVPDGAGKHRILDEWVPIAENRPTETIVFQLTLSDALTAVLSTLTPRERKVLQLRYGLEDGRLRTLEEVGHKFNVEREAILQIEAKALRKLRHPMRSKYLRDYLCEK